MKAVYDKLNNNVVLPFFELTPKVTIKTNSIKYGAFFIFEEGTGVNRKLKFKFIFGTNDESNILTYKIDKVVIKFHGHVIEGNSKTIETTDIAYTTTHRPAANKLKLYAKSISGPYNVYEGTIAKNMTDSDYPVFKPEHGDIGIDNNKFYLRVEAYIHLTEPSDCFVYLDMHTNFTNVSSHRVSGNIFSFRETSKIVRETEIQTPTIETDVTKRYYSITDSPGNEYLDNRVRNMASTGTIATETTRKMFGHFVTM